MNRTYWFWSTIKFMLPAAVLTAVFVIAAPAPTRASVIVQSVDPGNLPTEAARLAQAVSGSGLTNVTGSFANGVAAQFGTYSGFNKGPITIGNGIVLSSGIAGQVSQPPDPSLSSPFQSNDLGVSATPEFNAYGPGHIQNFGGSYDVAAFQVNFTLTAASQVQFDFVFGSVEFPFYTSQYPDSFLTFLDGNSNQIVSDKTGQAVQVGTSFAGLVSTQDQNTTFGSPHGVLGLTTTTVQLSAGAHSLLFEVGDVNDHILDSAAFISNLRVVSSGNPLAGTEPTDPTGNGYEFYHPVPEPSTFALVGLGAVGLLIGVYRRRCIIAV